MRDSAFSMIELLVVIAIVGILAALAIPSYSKNYAASSVSNSIAVGYTIIDDLERAYQTTGAFPNSLTFAGMTTPYFQNIFPNIQNITRIQYGNSTPDGKGVMIVLFLGPVPGYASTAGVVGLGVRDFNGTIKVACGNPGTGNTVVDSSILPSACVCQNVDHWSASGTVLASCP